MIRRATHADLDTVVRFGADFHAYSPWKSIPFDTDATREFVGRLIDGGVVFISETGMIGGMLNPLYFNPAYVTAVELFWWATKNGRELMQTFEDWAIEKGAHGIQFSALGDDKAERMAQLFDRAGYRKVETGYYREV